VRKLQEGITATASVRRDGAWAEVPRSGIVVGDVIRLAAGNLIPADARLIEARDLHVQQAALTGESLPAEKGVSAGSLAASDVDTPDLVFLGTSVVSGTATAAVVAVGAETRFGDIVARLAARPDETELERGMRGYGRLILRTTVVLVVFVLGVNFALGRDLFQSVLFSVALAVGLTPEFLPMIMTVTLAQGAVKLARARVIVKHLPAIQNLGSIDILCTDKTGTLTSGNVAFAASLDALGAPCTLALALAHDNARLQTGIASPLDAAILAVLTAGGDANATKTDEIPFDFERRRLSVVATHGSGYRLITKGAPEGVLAACSHYERAGAPEILADAAAATCLATFRELSARGYRVVAVAYRDCAAPTGYTRDDERDLVLAGFVTFADEVLPDVRTSLAGLAVDGVRVKILTGDNELVARHVCEQVGLDASRIVLGSELDNPAELDDVALAALAEDVTVFARVSPGQKHRIVRALKRAGHVVGFLGDGINDAPSLHAADVGISVANAVDVAREAADIVLLDRSLAVLHGGIVAGRHAFANILKYILMGTSSNFGNMFSMAGATLVLPFLPMLPIQILLNNFLYDFAQITIPLDNVDPEFLRRPQRWNIRTIRRFMWIVGPISSLFDYLTFAMLLLVFHFSAAAFHTGWFVESLATQTLVLLVIRTARRPWRDRPAKALAATTIGVAVVGAILPFVPPLANALGFTPLPLAYFGILAILVPGYLVVVELVKGRVWNPAVARESLATSSPRATDRRIHVAVAGEQARSASATASSR
jgi:Mg2+-importing ATPase